MVGWGRGNRPQSLTMTFTENGCQVTRRGQNCREDQRQRAKRVGKTNLGSASCAPPRRQRGLGMPVLTGRPRLVWRRRCRDHRALWAEGPLAILFCSEMDVKTGFPCLPFLLGLDAHQHLCEHVCLPQDPMLWRLSDHTPVHTPWVQLPCTVH